MILGKEIGNMDGYKYAIYQDTPTEGQSSLFHISVSKNDMVYYDYKENVTSMEELHDCVKVLIQELNSKVKQLYLSGSAETEEPVYEESV